MRERARPVLLMMGVAALLVAGVVTFAPLGRRADADELPREVALPSSPATTKVAAAALPASPASNPAGPAALPASPASNPAGPAALPVSPASPTAVPTAPAPGARTPSTRRPASRRYTRPRTRPEPAAPEPGRARPDPLKASGGYRRAVITDAGARRACLAAVTHAPGPLLVVVGASFTAGVGPGNPSKAWAVDLARELGWRTIVVGVPGIGYTHIGQGHIGPLSSLVRTVGVQRLRPNLMIVQAGHDDWRTRLAIERARVRAFYMGLRRQLPDSRLVALTVFTSGHRHHWLKLRNTNLAIVAGARAADPRLILMDPIVADWTFARAATGQLHPSSTGDERIADYALAALRAHDIRPAGHGPICDLLPTAPVRGWHLHHYLRGSVAPPTA